MPTAAKLFAAIAFAVMAWFASQAVVPLFPEGTDLGKFAYVNATIGALSGWLVMGRLAGAGYGAAVTSGLRTTAVFLFYALLVHSIVKMLDQAVRMRYSDTMEALAGVFELVGIYGMMVFTAPQVMGILLIGGVLAAWTSEFAAQRWN
ncbi:MAG: TrgA family protein [Rhodobacteraceae bacterium]|nr:TrgA family protein [Paracoccaceae bacterium]